MPEMIINGHWLERMAIDLSLPVGVHNFFQQLWAEVDEDSRVTLKVEY